MEITFWITLTSSPVKLSQPAPWRIYLLLLPKVTKLGIEASNSPLCFLDIKEENGFHEEAIVGPGTVIQSRNIMLA